MKRSMNEVVQARLGELAIRLCEYEVIVSEKDEYIKNLEARLAEYDAMTKPAE